MLHRVTTNEQPYSEVFSAGVLMPHEPKDTYADMVAWQLERIDEEFDILAAGSGTASISHILYNTLFTSTATSEGNCVRVTRHTEKLLGRTMLALEAYRSVFNRSNHITERNSVRFGSWLNVTGRVSTDREAPQGFVFRQDQTVSGGVQLSYEDANQGDVVEAALNVSKTIAMRMDDRLETVNSKVAKAYGFDSMNNLVLATNAAIQCATPLDAAKLILKA